MVLDTTELRQGMRCTYKGKPLTYQYCVEGVHPYYVFKTARGAQKRLSQMIVKRDVWVEIEEAITVAPNSSDRPSIECNIPASHSDSNTIQGF